MVMSVHDSYKLMGTDLQTLAGVTEMAVATGPRATLVIHLGGDDGSRVIDLPDGIDVTFGRSRGATITLDHEKVSRMHARIRRTSDAIAVEDLGSRNGTRVNGAKIEGITRIVHGDEVSVGPIIAIVNVTSGLRHTTPIADSNAGEQRLAAEVDRAVRYHRPCTLALLRIPSDAVVEQIAATLRPMDMLAEDAGDDYIVILPELSRADGTAAVQRAVDMARAANVTIAVATAQCPDDGTSVERLVGQLRAGLRTGHPPRAETEVARSPLVHDPAMQRVYALVDRIADTAMTALILGETGVGKEVICEAIHARSSRRDRPLIKLNCAALPETLLESELFGHERGAFTGADRRKVGFFEAADGGTLFLDEIGDMPLTLQAKLLRVLERKVITRVGGTTEVATDARVIAATHRDLDADVRTGRFRQDLLFRIGGFTIVIPPLRDRPDEILPLAEHFVRTGSDPARATPRLSADARDALVGYAWPGNVRELKNAIERALVLSDDEITAADLPERMLDASRRTRPIGATLNTGARDVRGQLAEVERAAIVAALEADGHNQTRAARRLGLSRRALIYKMEKYGLKAAPTRGES
jgi:two-component system response regulator AtoC